MKKDKRIILASNSPRRKELLALFGFNFEIKPADVDESLHAKESPGEYVLRLAEEKARKVGSLLDENVLMIAADTTVADKDEILGKPKGESEARLMLRQLKGRVHQVYTGLAVYHPENEKLEKSLVCTDVPMRDYSEEEMKSYITTGDPYDKAGGYAIQHRGFRPVDKLSGCYANVVGLPLCHLQILLSNFGLDTPDIFPSCQKSLDYNCDVYASVLEGDL